MIGYPKIGSLFTSIFSHFDIKKAKPNNLGLNDFAKIEKENERKSILLYINYCINAFFSSTYLSYRV